MESMISILGEEEAINSLGSRLRQQRLRQNLSQQHVADIVGVTLPTYRKIEQGNGTIEFRFVARALAVLGYGEVLADLIPAIEPELRLKDLLRPTRHRASRRRTK